MSLESPCGCMANHFEYSMQHGHTYGRQIDHGDIKCTVQRRLFSFNRVALRQQMSTSLLCRIAKSSSVFTARCYACAVLATGLCPSVCLCLSQVGVLLKRITQTTSHDSPRDSSFLTPKISAKFYRGNPYGDAKCRWGGSNRRLSTNNRLYRENGKG